MSRNLFSLSKNNYLHVSSLLVVSFLIIFKSILITQPLFCSGSILSEFTYIFFTFIITPLRNEKSDKNYHVNFQFSIFFVTTGNISKSTFATKVAIGHSIWHCKLELCCLPGSFNTSQRINANQKICIFRESNKYPYNGFVSDIFEHPGNFRNKMRKWNHEEAERR